MSLLCFNRNSLCIVLFLHYSIFIMCFVSNWAIVYNCHLITVVEARVEQFSLSQACMRPRYFLNYTYPSSSKIEIIWTACTKAPQTQTYIEMLVPECLKIRHILNHTCPITSNTDIFWTILARDPQKIMFDRTCSRTAGIMLTVFKFLYAQNNVQ